jgi:hypothetical protein
MFFGIFEISFGKQDMTFGRFWMSFGMLKRSGAGSSNTSDSRGASDERWLKYSTWALITRISVAPTLKKNQIDKTRRKLDSYFIKTNKKINLELTGMANKKRQSVIAALTVMVNIFVYCYRYWQERSSSWSFFFTFRRKLLFYFMKSWSE